MKLFEDREYKELVESEQKKLGEIIKTLADGNPIKNIKGETKSLKIYELPNGSYAYNYIDTEEKEEKIIISETLFTDIESIKLKRSYPNNNEKKEYNVLVEDKERYENSKRQNNRYSFCEHLKRRFEGPIYEYTKIEGKGRENEIIKYEFLAKELCNSDSYLEEMPNPAPIFIIKYNEDDKNVENYKIYNNNPGSNIKQYVSYNQGSQKKQVKDVSEAFELMAKKDVAEDFQETFREKVAGSFTKLLDVSNKELDIKEADKSKNDIERYKDYIKKVDKNVEIEEENDFLKTEVSKNTKLNEELKTKNEELSSQNSKLDKEISEKQTKLKKADDLMSEYKDAIRILQEKLEKQQNIINNLIEEDKKIPVFVQRIFGKKDNNKALPESSNER